MTNDELNFLTLYLKNPGMSVKQAAANSALTEKEAYALLERPPIQEQLNLARSSQLITQQYILGNIKRIADISLSDLPLPNTTTPENPDGLRSYDSTAALRALELLGKNQKLFTDRLEALNVQTPFEEYIRQVEDKDEF